MNETTESDNFELLRTGVSKHLNILNCDIHIDINRDLKTAKYKYCYTIKILNQGINQWREVFDYKIDEVNVSGSHDKDGGLGYSTKNQGRYTLLTIDFRNNLSQNEEYYFDYTVETKIESISKMHRVLGGIGAVWFWCSHEFPINTIAVHFKLPNGVSINESHPNGAINDGIVKITKTNLDPNEFFSGIIQIEKKIFGLSSVWGDRLYRAFWFVVGAIITILISEIYTYIKSP